MHGRVTTNGSAEYSRCLAVTAATYGRDGCTRPCAKVLCVGRITFAIVAFVMLACWPVPAADLAGRASVIDGDTIEIHGQRMRLYGIDAPESRQKCEVTGQTYRCGQQAALALAGHIAQRTVDCEPRDTDRYGRIVAVCRAGAEDLNAWMVAQGWALAYRQYSRAYVGQETAAHAAGLGIWRGAFTAPWDWRYSQRTTTVEEQTTPPQPAAACCMVCTTGKACGNGCISRSKTCYKPAGCACNPQ
jgi:endonuclease YncB( thermonuclease family)